MDNKITNKMSRTKRLLSYLRDERTGRYIPAKELSGYLDVSTRQIRKYISKINEDSGQELILSCNLGYRLDSDAYVRFQETAPKQRAETPEMRRNYIIQKLICSRDGYDIFDFADELFISAPTLENDLKGIRDTIKPYSLTLRREKNLLQLDGAEKAKRAFMNSLLTSDSYDSFVLKDEVQLLTFHYHFWDFRSNIREIFAQNDIFANDYILNNTALHLIIMIDRIRNGCTIKEEADLSRFVGTVQYQASRQMKAYIEATYQASLDDSELYNLTLLISNATTTMDYSFINTENLNEFIEQKYIDMSRRVIRRVEECYCLDPFDEEFISKFTIHVKNMFVRIENQYYAKNPLTAKIKTTYPLIYDIAVFIAQEFKADYGLCLNEDEIAFIAFHIGSYFENNVLNKNFVVAAFIYADYYSLHKNTLDKIIRVFSDKLRVKYAISLHNFQPAMLHADFVISTVDMPFQGESVLIHPFLTDRDMKNLQEVIDRISLQKRGEVLENLLKKFFSPNLFYRNPKAENRQEVIRILCDDAVSKSLTDSDFHETVMSREHMSSTAFYDVAIPHTLSKNVRQTFISAALFEKGVPWDGQTVHMVLLIGINDESRKVFSQIFDELIEILSDPSNVKELTGAADFQHFIDALGHMVSRRGNP